MSKQDLKRKEHEAVRDKVGFFDFAHDILEVTGKDAKCFLDYMCVNVISDLKPHQASYTTILDKEANALDDVIVFYHGDDRYWVSTLFIDKLTKWFNEHLDDKDVHLKDITDKTSLYSVQGPNSKAVLNDLLKKNIDDLAYFEFKKNKLDDIDLIVSRTGFTGELGYELYFDPKYTDRIVDGLKEKGKAYDIMEITTDVTLTSLPTEKGYITVDDFKGANPIELDLEWSVDCEKDFVGKDKLCLLKDEGSDRKLVGFSIENKNANIEKGDKVKFQGKEIGEVTTFTYGYTVEKYIGYVLVDSKYADAGTEIKIESAGKEIDATIENKIFYDPKGVRVRG